MTLPFSVTRISKFGLKVMQALMQATSLITSILYTCISQLFSKIVSWKSPGIAASFSILSRISARLRREMSSVAANEVSRVASCLLSSSNLLAEVAFVVGRGSQGVVEKYAGAFGNTDGTASFFKYLRHSSLSPCCFCRDEFLSWLYSTKSLSLKCSEQRPELVVG